MTSKREEVLLEAAKLITGDRNETYGSPTQNFQDTADVWNVLLRDKLKGEAKITPGEVAAMMAALKLVRMIAQPKRDNWVDLAGYAACGYEVDVETGRINEPSTQTSWGKPGDKITIELNTPEPTHVTALQEVITQSGCVPWILTQAENNLWRWWCPSDMHSTTIFTWQEFVHEYAGTLTLEVVG